MGCARTLAADNHDFVMLTRDVGGRVTSSRDGAVNYGAFYARSDYRHVSAFLHRKRQIRFDASRFRKGDRVWSFWDVVRAHPLMIVRLYHHILVFDEHYQRFKKRCEQESQCDALRRDPYLRRMHEERAVDFLRAHNLQSLIPLVIDPLVRATAFLDVEESSLSAAGVLLLLLIGRYASYAFELRHDALIAGIADRVVLAEVESVERGEDRWRIRTTLGEVYSAETIVVATPIDVAKRLLHMVCATNRPISVHMAHVRGVLLPQYHIPGDVLLLAPHETPDIVITRESDGTHLFYSHNPKYDLTRYFAQHEVIAEKFWHPAFFVGHCVLSAKVGKRCFVIGDHNICGMEDAYLSGMGVARQLMRREDGVVAL